MWRPRARIAVAGAGWWSQGWHLPHLSRHAGAKIAAIIEPSAAPRSAISTLEQVSALGTRYSASTFSTLDEMLGSSTAVDGLLVCTSHASHYALGARAIGAGLHVLMEKPMTTDVDEARELAALADAAPTWFAINNTANWRRQAVVAAELVRGGAIGEVQHVAASMHSPLLWLFDDPANAGWTQPSPGMAGNGFGYGQLSHLLGWIFQVSGLKPLDAYAVMTRAEHTGADLTDAAVLRCLPGGASGGAVASVSVSGSATVPGNAHADEQARSIGKHVSIRIFGSAGMLSYEGDDQRPESGRLNLRTRDGAHGVAAEGFAFENYDEAGDGPESLHAFVDACRGEPDAFVGASAEIGLQTVRALDAMYRSARSGEREEAR